MIIKSSSINKKEKKNLAKPVNNILQNRAPTQC